MIMSSGTEIIKGFEWNIEKNYIGDKSYYLADCEDLCIVTEGATWEEMMENIDDICDDIMEEFGSLEEYAKIVRKKNDSSDKV